MRRHVLVAVMGAVALLASAFVSSSSAQEPPESASGVARYSIRGPNTAQERTEISQTGVAIDAVQHDSVVVTATPSQADEIAALGYDVEQLSAGPLAVPPGYEDYHDFAEMTQAINDLVAAKPDIASQSVIGSSHEGRDITAVKISDNVGTDEAEPEVLFTHSQHAREILTVEMAIYLVQQFTEGYGSDQQITDLVDSREIWIIPNSNPDGSEFDKSNPDEFQWWRKNRQPNSGSSAIGTDMNRNWDYNWGCCGGSSGSPSGETYRGAAPESAPEVKVVADFVRSRVVDGQQQITSHIDWHTYSELILWPYGFTYDDTAPGLDERDQKALSTLGQQMADTNGYTPQQSSDLYITDGTINDWMWGEYKIFSYTFEMYPSEFGGDQFYPPDDVIDRETSRNREASLLFVDYADCPYRVIGETC